MKISFDNWIDPALKIVNILEESNLNYAFFGAVAISILSKPLATKDVDILIHPFPKEDTAFHIIDSIRNVLNVKKASLELDAVEGNRIILIIETKEGPLGIDMWEKILRRDAKTIIEEIEIIEYKGKQVRILSPEALLAAKICELTPEPLDKEKIESLIEHRKEINYDKTVDIIYRLGHEWTALLNITMWYPTKKPRFAKIILEKIIQKMPPKMRKEAIEKAKI